MAVEVRGSTAEVESVHHSLREFEAPLSRPADIVWIAEGDAPPSAKPLRMPDAGETRGHLEVTDGEWRLYGTGIYLFAALQEHLLKGGCSLVHGCAIDYDGSGALFFGEGGVGKSTIAFSAYKEPRVRLLSDDKAVFRRDGTLFSFPTPLSIYGYHHQLIDAPARAGLTGTIGPWRVLSQLVRVPFVRRVGGAVRRRLLSRGGRVGLLAKTLNPDYLAIPRGQLFTPEQVRSETDARFVFWLGRGGTEIRVEELSFDEAASLLLASTYQELELESSLATFAIAGAIDYRRHYEQAIDVTKAFLGEPRTLLRLTVPPRTDPPKLQRFVLDLLQERTAT